MLACQVEGIQREVYPAETYVWESLQLHFTLLGSEDEGYLTLQVHLEGHFARGVAPPKNSGGYAYEIPRTDLETYGNRLIAAIREGI